MGIVLVGVVLVGIVLVGIVLVGIALVGVAQVGSVQWGDSFRKQQVEGKRSNHCMLAYRTACCRTAGNLHMYYNYIYTRQKYIH